MTAQCDEPNQKGCIFKVTQPAKKRKTDKLEPAQDNFRTRFKQIRVKSLEFLAEPATAIYFYDMTHHMESLKKKGEDI